MSLRNTLVGAGLGGMISGPGGAIMGGMLGNRGRSLPIVGGLFDKPRVNPNGFDKARTDLLPLYEQAEALYSPYTGLAGALPQMQQDVNAGRYNAQFSETPEFQQFNFDYQQDPSYQFALEQGNKALQNQLAASGMRGGGNAMREAMKFGTGLAQQDYGNAFNRALQGYQANQGNRIGLAQLRSNVENMRAGQLQNQFQNQLGIAGLGMGAIGAQAGLKTGLAGNLTDLQVGKFQADEARRIANQNSENQLMGSLLGAGATLGGMALFSDSRLKENIKYIGNEKGHNMYEFNYIGNPQRYRGVLAQDVLQTNPEAVETENGYLKVDYNKLGLEMRAV